MSGAHEPIAVIGIGCRFPGDANSPEEFWQLLRDGVDAITEVPVSRWDADAFYDPELASAGSMNTRWGGFLRRVDEFDHRFFGISRREACTIDPAQRILIETAWEALENAGLAPNRLAGSATGVFVGMSNWDYSLLHEGAPSRGATGIARSITPNRVSYFFDFHGPSMVVDTACSSSIVALDLACESLRSGAIDLALVGGVNVILYPYLSVSAAQAGMLSPDGRCKTFDERADGYSRGEGCGLVVLKRLSDAQADRHEIAGLIYGTAVNQDGRSNGLTAPNPVAQQAVVRQALKNAGVLAGQIGYVEAHGTGTALGDAVEVESLSAVLGGVEGTVCRIGSVKANIGHPEAAAGAAGLIKVLLSMKHEEIPPQVHLTRINPKLKLTGRMRIATRRCAWPRTDQPRFAGVASFGVGGTNAHAVVGEAPERVRTAATIERPLHLLTLSAASRNALAKLTERYAVYLGGTEEPLADICSTANAGRSHFAHRLAVWAGSTDEIVRILGAGDDACLRRGEVETGATVGLRFPGNVTPACVQALFATQPTFLKAFEACEEFLGESLRQSICPAAVFAAEYALGRMWQSWGIDAGAGGGRGVGRLVAGCLAGELDWTKGLTLSASSDVADGEILPGGKRVIEIGLAEGSWQDVLSKVADLHVSGVSVDWEGFDRDYLRHRVVLPTYPFERTRCWLNSPELRPLPGPFSEARR